MCSTPWRVSGACRCWQKAPITWSVSYTHLAEPGKKDVPGVGHLGFPIIEIAEDGSFFVTKVPEAGGMVKIGRAHV